MNAINISIGGVIVSIFYIFLCISLNAEHYYKELRVGHNVKDIPTPAIKTTKPTVVLRDRNSNNTTQIKEENISLNRIEVLKAVEKPLSETSTIYLLSDNNVSEQNSSKSNCSSSKMVLDTIQDKISTLLHEKQITFKKNSGKLSKEGKEVLRQLVILLSEQKKFTIEVQGHTDAGGKAKINQWISQMRANRVKKYLLEQGISSKNITAKGFGESQLLFSDKPYSQKNRRVEIYIKRRENVRVND
jgi:outer membrane protein OmpA-like peptidoglycan-associated protein